MDVALILIDGDAELLRSIFIADDLKRRDPEISRQSTLQGVVFEFFANCTRQSIDRVRLAPKLPRGRVASTLQVSATACRHSFSDQPKVIGKSHGTAGGPDST
jgi:hypothetical protein